MNAVQTQADVVVQKSIKEGFGLTVTEALWKAHPTVAGNVGGIPLQIVNGETGFLVNSAEEYTQHCIQLLEDREEARAMARRGKQRVRHNFPDPPPAARLARDLHEALGELTSWAVPPAPLILVSNRGPVTFARRPNRGAGAPARGRRPRDGADGPDRALARAVDLGRDLGGRRGGRRQGRRRRLRASGPRRRHPRPLRDDRPRDLPRLLQRGRQPDAVVHPALPLGPRRRARPAPRGEGRLGERLSRPPTPPSPRRSTRSWRTTPTGS